MSRVDALWLRMAAIYPHTWTSALGDSPRGIAGETWGSALTGIAPDQLAEGLRACVAEGREFPPSAGRFRAMCLGIPALAAVKSELLTRDGARTPFGLLVWQGIDAYALRQADARAADRIVADAYDLARERVMRGEPLPILAAAAITQDSAKPEPSTPERAAAAMAECRELLRRPDPETELAEHYAGIDKPADPAGVES